MIDPITDRQRLQEIVDLDLLSSEIDTVLAEIARDAATALDLPVALVTIVLDEAQQLAAMHGVPEWVAEIGGMPIEWSFCAHSVRSRQPLVIADATAHPILRDNPSVTQEGVRCYAGIPLITSRGHVLGNLCVLGTETREFSDQDVATLRGFAARAIARIEARRIG
jgi:GAF domain-containing protein